jgi:4-amino-4-deoxy-L-arabinose transferase-like glycosyltransferase
MTTGVASPTPLGLGRLRSLVSAERAAWMFVWSLVAVRIALSVYRISRPGLQADETLFVNAATLRIPGEFIQYQIGGIPILVSPYIGALKSWIYAPIFSVFGGSALTIRLPVILITTAGLPLVYIAVRNLVNRPVALLSVTLLSFDNSVFWLTRDDVGPNAIEFFLKCAALLCCARLARDRRPRWVVLLLIVLALGAFNKLNFIWTVNAAVAASVVVAVYYRRALRSARAVVATWVGGLVALYAGFAAYYLGEHISALNAPAHHGSLISYTWPLYEQGTKQILSGTWFLDYALTPTNPWLPVVWTIVALFAIGALTSVAVRRLRSMTIACLSLVTVLTGVQILFTSQATAGWHYIAIYPFVMIVAAYGAWSLARLLLRRETWIAVAVAVVGLAALTYDGVLMGKYFRTLDREPHFSAWTTAIYPLSRYVRRLGGTVFVVDWGIYDPLLALDPSRRYLDEEFSFVNSDPVNLKDAAALVAGVAGPKLIVTHADGSLVFPTVNANLRRAEAGHLTFLRTVTGVDGKPLYLVYRYH